MRIFLEPGKCQGHARCFEVARDLFTLDDTGYSDLPPEGIEVPSGREDAARMGVASCPERALRLQEG
jgi:ferredoxin